MEPGLIRFNAFRHVGLLDREVIEQYRQPVHGQFGDGVASDPASNDIGGVDVANGAGMRLNYSQGNVDNVVAYGRLGNCIELNNNCCNLLFHAKAVDSGRDYDEFSCALDGALTGAMLPDMGAFKRPSYAMEESAMGGLVQLNAPTNPSLLGAAFAVQDPGPLLGCFTNVDRNIIRN